MKRRHRKSHRRPSRRHAYEGIPTVHHHMATPYRLPEGSQEGWFSNPLDLMENPILFENPLSSGEKIAIGVVVLAAVGVGAYFLLRPKPAAAAGPSGSGGNTTPPGPTGATGAPPPPPGPTGAPPPPAQATWKVATSIEAGKHYRASIPVLLTNGFVTTLPQVFYQNGVTHYGPNDPVPAGWPAGEDPSMTYDRYDFTGQITFPLPPLPQGVLFWVQS